MKYLLLLFSAAVFSCTSGDKEAQSIPTQQLNVAYGDDPQQTYDIYIPAAASSATKIIVLIHGGGWIGGDKADMNYLVQAFRINHPQYAIVNINYRLATASSSVYPKQTDDIAAVLSHVESHNKFSHNYGMLGTSAGGHLAMLYSYRSDAAHEVKAICNIVGPTDFNDPSYAGSELETSYLPYLSGGDNSPEYLASVSPITHVNAQSAPTIQFMGNADPLIPVTQGQRLKTRLDSFGVPNELYIYNAGHETFSATDIQDIFTKLGFFFDAHL